MTTVWHGVPRDMIGETLFPLGQLNALDVGLYDEQRAKYAGREQVLDYRVPLLGCGFLDTIHCSSVHPHRIYQARRDAGFDVPARSAAGWGIGLAFEIPLERILVNPTLWYAWRTPWVNGYPDEEVALAPPSEEFEMFDPQRYWPLADVPDLHRAYLARRSADGRRALTFVHIPHVLVAGPIDVHGCRVVRWEEPPED